MHNIYLKKFYFIDHFNKEHIRNLDKSIIIIYRNYSKKYSEKEIIEIKKFCKNIRRKFYLANNIMLTNKLNLDGAYIPSFNRDLSVRILKIKKIHLLGSAHSIKEINEKKRQGIDLIFISPVFKVKKTKNFLGIIKFNNLSKLYDNKSVALGGINQNNIKQIKSENCCGFASISYIKESEIF
jgi:thiamine-phosphate pyrophosphorylase|tara:strand:+ start:519 stop:1064 length:546 start_codon:yes stop_codon:yes gene_type:complete